MYVCVYKYPFNVPLSCSPLGNSRFLKKSQALRTELVMLQTQACSPSICEGSEAREMVMRPSLAGVRTAGTKRNSGFWLLLPGLGLLSLSPT